MSPVDGSRYFIIDGDSYPIYILNHLWGPIFVCFGGAIRTYTAHLKILRWEISGSLPKTNYRGEEL